MKFFPSVMAVALGCVNAIAQLPNEIIRAQVPEVYEVYEVLSQSTEAGARVRVFGQNFDRTPTNNIVHIGGARARVLRSWVSELEVELPPAVQAGPVTVVVSNKLAMSQVPFRPRFMPYGTNQPVYAPVASFGGARHPAALDLDNDGKLELVLARHPNQIEVYQYVESGPVLSSNSFKLVASLAGVTNTASIRVMDLNSDGRYDLLVASTNAGGSVIVNRHMSGEISANSLGRLNAPVDLRTGFFDVDRDGTMDLIRLNGTSLQVNRGVPQFPHGDTYYSGISITNVGTINSMAVGDLNRDGHVDIVTLNGQKMTIFSHNGRMGIIGDFVQFSIPAENLTAVQIADVEGDGWPDIVVFDQSAWKCEVFWNRNIGGHISAEDFSRVTLVFRENSRLIAPQLVDLDGDAFPDLVTRSSIYHKNESALLNGVVFSGSFATTNYSGVWFDSPVGMISADLNADGLPEVITDEGVVYQNMSVMAPVIIGARRLPTGEVLMEIVGRGGEEVTMQRSADLKDWTVFQNSRVSDNGRATWSALSAGNAGFFRVVR